MPFDDTTPALELQPNGRTYRTLHPITWTPRRPNRRGYRPVTVPAGFLTDFASVPRMFWGLFPPAGRWSLAAIVHDYLCRAEPQGWDSKLAAQCFRTIMRELGVGWLRRSIMYRAVRIGGPRF